MTLPPLESKSFSDRVDDSAKGKKWGSYEETLLRKLGGMIDQGWTAAYTDGLAKQVGGGGGGGGKRGYGVFFAEGSDRNYGAPVPQKERQIVS